MKRHMPEGRKNNMKIAITGFRGIPANYGGFETFVEELAPRLVQRGHDVTVYCRSNNITWPEEYYKGVRLVILPTISHKYFDTVIHTFLSLLHCAFRKNDIVFVLNAANSPLVFIPRLAGARVALNVDGIERLRKKWNIIGRLYYRIGEYFATKFPNVMVSDADVIYSYYRETYGKESIMIPYGANMEKSLTTDALDIFGIKPREYVLYVSRLEPENNADKVIMAFKRTRTDKKLVIVGDAPYAEEYKARLRELAGSDPRILFTGFVYGAGYREFQTNAYCYIQATEVGGTHPALIEAMALEKCVIANGTPENREVLSDTGIIYLKNDVDDLHLKLQQVLDNPALCTAYGKKAGERVALHYSWDAVTNEYEMLFADMLNGEIDLKLNKKSV